MKTQEKKNKDKRIWKLFSILFGLIFLACIIWLAVYLVQSIRMEKQLEEMKTVYVQEETGEALENQDSNGEETNEADLPDLQGPEDEAQGMETESGEPSLLDEYEVPVKEIDWDALKAENEDIYAWITVPGTVIDYPVLQHPDDLDYYLQHNLDKSSGYPGCIYSQFYNSKDWDDPHTVLYGHNMRNGSMFAGLHQYEDSQFFEEHPYVYIYSEDDVRVYQIFAAYEFSSAHLLLCFDTKNPETFGAYLEGIFQRDGMNDNFNREITVTTEDKLLTLSTCISKKPDNRYLVQAVLVAEGVIEN